MRPRDVLRQAAEAGQLEGLTGVDLTVLWDIADRAYSTGRSSEPLAAIADRYGWHYRTVRRSLQRIEATGIVRVQRRPNTSSVITFPVSTANPQAAPMSAPGEEFGRADQRAGRADERARPRRSARRTEVTELTTGAAAASMAAGSCAGACAHRWRSEVDGACGACGQVAL